MDIDLESLLKAAKLKLSEGMSYDEAVDSAARELYPSYHEEAVRLVRTTVSGVAASNLIFGASAALDKTLELVETDGLEVRREEEEEEYPAQEYSTPQNPATDRFEKISRERTPSGNHDSYGKIPVKNAQYSPRPDPAALHQENRSLNPDSGFGRIFLGVLAAALLLWWYFRKS